MPALKQENAREKQPRFNYGAQVPASIQPILRPSSWPTEQAQISTKLNKITATTTTTSNEAVHTYVCAKRCVCPNK